MAKHEYEKKKKKKWKIQKYTIHKIIEKSYA